MPKTCVTLVGVLTAVASVLAEPPARQSQPSSRGWTLRLRGPGKDTPTAAQSQGQQVRFRLVLNGKEFVRKGPVCQTDLEGFASHPCGQGQSGLGPDVPSFAAAASGISYTADFVGGLCGTCVTASPRVRSCAVGWCHWCSVAAAGTGARSGSIWRWPGAGPRDGDASGRAAVGVIRARHASQRVGKRS